MSQGRERQLRDMLTYLQDSYQEAAQPIIDELTEIEMRKPSVPIMMFPMTSPATAEYMKILEMHKEKIHEMFYQGIVG
jgi:hypothetical protein